MPIPVLVLIVAALGLLALLLKQLAFAILSAVVQFFVLAVIVWILYKIALFLFHKGEKTT